MSRKEVYVFDKVLVNVQPIFVDNSLFNRIEKR